MRNSYRSEVRMSVGDSIQPSPAFWENRQFRWGSCAADTVSGAGGRRSVCQRLSRITRERNRLLIPERLDPYESPTRASLTVSVRGDAMNRLLCLASRGASVIA